ncbi:DUF3095 domain-containing protein [[Pseudomonas] carboxydohydrogena]|uniref:DUF3095 domain-containing protein n=1 Tax=Afipia carboxydohydrogena TaxID=290 RepID=A0ABY8BSM7_AFICR|nr:DUF3095 domain-containing protein [[Pseudomonas] carboxydohydrogena]WEF51884.1 DUF3095 domain-containing protein [[Pseudomonas] carboxydohydrogena]
MNRDKDAAFYSGIPAFDDFGRLMEPSLYRPLPEGWLIGTADIVRSTDAIANRRYKAVNMAGAAVIAAMTNAMELRDFPFVFGGDGASFAVAAADREIAARVLAETAAWVDEALHLTMRVALVPVEAIRAAGLDVRVARYAPSPHVSYAMFEGGGLRWADAAMKRGAFAVPQAPRGSHPDLTGLSCHFSEILSARGVMLSILVVPHGDNKSAFRAVIERMLALVEMSPEGGRPIPPQGPPRRWPSPGADYVARAWRRGPLWWRRGVASLGALWLVGMARSPVRIGRYAMRTYLQQVVENSDFRKYDDGLRMVIDCPPQTANAIEKLLARAAEAGTIRYGLHRQDAALMTCFTLAAAGAGHFHFVDGARGGYASAAVALKAAMG